MSLAPGTRLGPYEVTASIGLGGMGEVYRATDTNLKRQVAIKVLLASLSDDPDRLARFQREAEILAALNHPQIAQIYGVEKFNGATALVIELVEGPTLADRVAQGPLPIDEALAIARQIAEALEAAHEQSIIHRDLKPSNIKIRPDGTVKVLDFGLAKVIEPVSGSPDVFEGSTATRLATTRVGVVLGTAAYMAPEQARGKPVDKRADIWGFGAVLYEMLTGRMAFRGATFTDTMAAVLEREPDWSALPPGTPAPIERLLRRCLEKDSRRRMRDAADVRIEIEDALRPPAIASVPAAVPSSGRRRPVLLLALLALLALTLVAIALGEYLHRAPAPASVTRLSLSAPGTIQAQIAPAVSPDGRRVAFVSTSNGSRPMLWVRDLDALEPRLLAGTEDAAHPFWSPDSLSIAFTGNGKLRRVNVATGAVLTLADACVRCQGAWSPNDVILFQQRTAEWATMPAGGGRVTALTIDVKGASWPRFLPSGDHFLFVGWDDQQSWGVYVGSLGSKVPRRLMTSGFEAAYAPAGYLLFLREGTLMAQRFDANSLELTGTPEPVAENIFNVPMSHHASWSVSDTGVLAYTNATLLDTQLARFDRKGQPLGVIGPPDRLANEMPQIAPDGQHVAIARDRTGDEDIWLYDLSGDAPSRVTLSHGLAHAPIWLTASRLAFQSGARPKKLVSKDVAPVGPEVPLADLPPDAFLYDVSRDGRYGVYSAAASNGRRDLWVAPLSGGQPFLFAHSANANNAQAQISPNGQWAAYTSYESGRDEVYVDSFPRPGNKRQISTGGGVQPRWRRDGSELFYLSTDQTLMSVPILNPKTLQSGSPQALFRTRLVAQGSQTAVFDTLYDVAADGQTFLMNVDPANPGPPYTVVLNWTAGLKR